MPNALKRETSLVLLSWLVFAGAGYFLLQSQQENALVWLLTTLVVLLIQGVILWRDLPQNYRPDNKAEILSTLGLGNHISLVRVPFIAGTIGFWLLPWPADRASWVAWLPAILYSISWALDFFDGYAARVTNTITVLGSRLDGNLDGLGLFAAAVLSWQYGQTGWWYLLAAATRYLYDIGIWLHTQRGGTVLALPPSDPRRTQAAIQMIFLSIMLWPIFYPPVTTLASICFVLPFLLGFLSDFLYVTGATKTSFNAPQIQGLNQWTASSIVAFLNRALVAGLLIWLIAEQPSWPLLIFDVLFLAAVVFGVAGRSVGLALILLVGFHSITHAYDWHLIGLIISTILLAFIGTGPYSRWQPETQIMAHRAGQRNLESH